MKWLLVVAALAPGSDEKGVDALTLQTLTLSVRQVEEVMEPALIKQFVVDELKRSGDIPNPEEFADMFLGRANAQCYRSE